MSDKVTLRVEGPVAVITNNNPDKHNAFDDDMDVALFDALSDDPVDPRCGRSSGGGKGSRSRPAVTSDRSER